MAESPDLTVPGAARFLLSEERMERFVEMYRRAAATDDKLALRAAEEAMSHFRDAEAALTRMMATEAAVTKFIGDV